jgi:hypothetical protein
MQNVLYLCLTLCLAACSSSKVPAQDVSQSLDSSLFLLAAESPSPEIESDLVVATEEAICFRLLTPEVNSEMANEGLVVFDWQMLPEAASYQVQIELPNGNFEYFNSEVASLDKFMASLPLGGSYEWRVLAFDAGGDPICFSDSFSFSKGDYEVP